LDDTGKIVLKGFLLFVDSRVKEKGHQQHEEEYVKAADSHRLVKRTMNRWGNKQGRKATPENTTNSNGQNGYWSQGRERISVMVGR
jgi:hypothetical protein